MATHKTIGAKLVARCSSLPGATEHARVAAPLAEPLAAGRENAANPDYSVFRRLLRPKNLSCASSSCSRNRSYIRCHVLGRFAGNSPVRDGLPPRRSRTFCPFLICRVHASCLQLSLCQFVAVPVPELPRVGCRSGLVIGGALAGFVPAISCGRFS
jgi:hypothetical protein